MKNLKELIKQNGQNIQFTKDETSALEQFLNEDINTKKVSLDLESALLKIGMVVPMSNRAGKGKKIINLLMNNKKEEG